MQPVWLQIKLITHYSREWEELWWKTIMTRESTKQQISEERDKRDKEMKLDVEKWFEIHAEGSEGERMKLLHWEPLKVICVWKWVLINRDNYKLWRSDWMLNIYTQRARGLKVVYLWVYGLFNQWSEEKFELCSVYNFSKILLYIVCVCVFQKKAPKRVRIKTEFVFWVHYSCNIIVVFH